MMACTSGNEMRIINRRMQRHRSGRPNILVAVIVHHIFQFVRLVADLIQNHMVVHRASGTLKGNVRIE